MVHFDFMVTLNKSCKMYSLSSHLNTLALISGTRVQCYWSEEPKMKSSLPREFIQDTNKHIHACGGKRDLDVAVLFWYRGPEDIMSNRGNDLLLKLLQYRSDTIHTSCLICLRSFSCVHLSVSLSLRYPKVMTDDAIRAVRQWLAAGTQIEGGVFL